MCAMERRSLRQAHDVRKRILFLSILLIAISILSGCASAPLRFQVPDSQAMREWANQWYVDEEVAFQPAGLQNGGDALYVYGSLDASTAAVRSFLLRSEDGGRTWVEVGVPVEGSRIADLSFSGPSAGCARIERTQGGTIAQCTQDGGKTWSALPASSADDKPAIRSTPTVVQSDGATFTLMEKPEGWALIKDAQGTPTRVFTFPKQVFLSDVAVSGAEDCGCPAGKIRKRMLH